MKRPILLWILLLSAVAAGAALRFPQLNLRPMHCDEAILADKFGTLLESGTWKYDPTDYHGPTLIYLSLIPAWFSRVHYYRDLTETTLRIVPACFGILLVLLPLAFWRGISRRTMVIAVWLTALSPAMVYYSRYYIPEILLLFFTFLVIAAGYYYFRTRKSQWALAAGIGLGWMAATKETAVISYGTMALAFLLTLFWSEGWQPRKWWRQIHWGHFLLLVSGAGITAGWLLSSFGADPSGVLEFAGSFVNYAHRAGLASWHLHPWHYYFGLLLFFYESPGPYWSEGFLLALAIAGAVFIWGKRTNSGGHASVAAATGLLGNQGKGRTPGNSCSSWPPLLGFLFFYTILTTLVYSCIHYKTPWCLINFHQGVILLAAVGAEEGFWKVKGKSLRGLFSLLVLAGVIHLGWQSCLGNFKYPSDPGNPYVYAHTGMDVYEIVQKVDRLAAVHPDGNNMLLQVFTRQNLWPLPWYFRQYPRQQWWSRVEDLAPLAQVVIATPEMENALVRKIYELPPPGQREMYMRMFDREVALRPQVEVRGYVAKSLWDRLENQ